MVDRQGDRVIAFLVAPEGAEQVELTEPWGAVRDAGATPCLVSTEGDTIRAFNHLDAADTFPVDCTLEDADAKRFDALVLPGGVANPDLLRTHKPAVAFVGDFFARGKPVAAICHAPWILVEAGEVAGRTLTSWPSLRTDIVNAGGEWVDRPVVVCDRGANTLITSRKPKDLPKFCAAIVDALG